MLFEDRIDAAHRLAERLAKYKGTNPLVLAIPRGGVPMGRVIADELGGELDVVLVRKLRAPFNPEFGIGAIDETGDFHVTTEAGYAGATPAYIEREKNAQLEQIRARRSRWSQLKKPIDPAGRVVIVVDDGLATGVTMASALQFLRRHNPKKLIVAVPVASTQGLQLIEPLADEVVTLAVPDPFRAVSMFYRDFGQVEDDEVVHHLAGGALKGNDPKPLRPSP
jgi:predicted phosphoribosyltransferase